MKRLTKPAVLATICILCISSLGAADLPRIEPSPWISAIVSKNGSFTVSQLIDAALYASGVDSKELPEYRDRIRSLLSGLPAYLQERRENTPRGEAVLHYLHENLFTRYREPQTLIHVTLDTGQYNCVSSAVMYAIAARFAGLPIKGVVTSDHAFCSVIEDGVETDVETTNPHGYNPGQKREFVNAFGQTGFTYVPPGNYHLRTALTQQELIGLILQNRIARLQRENRIDLTVPLAVDRYAMTGTDRTLAEMKKEFVNFIAVLNGEHRFDEAFEFLDQVRSRWGEHNAYMDSIDTLLYNSAVIAGREGREEDALARLSERFEKGDLSEDHYREYRQILGNELIYRYSREKDIIEARAELERLRESELLSDSIYNDYLLVFHIRLAKEIARDQGDVAALNYFREQGLQQSTDPRIYEALNIFTHNAAAFYHNRFVALFREKRYTEAETLIQEGLKQLSENNLLLRDQKILSQVRSN